MGFRGHLTYLVPVKAERTSVFIGKNIGGRGAPEFPVTKYQLAVSRRLTACGTGQVKKHRRKLKLADG